MELHRNMKHHQTTCRPQIIFPEKGSQPLHPCAYGPAMMQLCICEWQLGRRMLFFFLFKTALISFVRVGELECTTETVFKGTLSKNKNKKTTTKNKQKNNKKNQQKKQKKKNKQTKQTNKNNNKKKTKTVLEEIRS